METQDPFIQFDRWFDEAKASTAIAEPTAMVLSTIDAEGMPDARVVLLKAHDRRGFVFYTNLQSTKGKQLAAHAQAALTFHWMPLQYQVRIRGKAVPVSDAEADAYFATRERGSQIGAWASLQSEPLPSREELERRVAQLEVQFGNNPIPRPPHWSGLRVVPDTIEFWQQGTSRLHERQLYTRDGDSWKTTTLYP